MFTLPLVLKRMIALAGTGATLLAVTSCTDRKVTPAEGGHLAGTVLAQGFQVGVAESADVLFVVDDSASMLDKQQVLSQSLLSVLSTRRCRWDDSGREAPPSNRECPAGSHETSPLPASTRIGVLSSSLDVGGSDVCEDVNRHAHLLRGSNGELFASLDSPTFQDELEGVLGHILGTVGEHGCGYEAPLEVLYRFLADPEPPLAVELSEQEDGEFTGLARGIDEELLAERQAFLRPDSLLVAILLSDEDDCSVMDSGTGWRIAEPGPLPSSTSACSDDPQSQCCRSCGVNENEPPNGCPPVSEDERCKSAASPLDADHPNLRCFEQRRRFGESFLFPVERYVRAFASRKIEDRAGNIVENPIFSRGRDPSMFRLGAIVGVPWQTLATAESLHTPDALAYPSGQQLEESGGWQRLVGGPGVAPEDAHLVGSIEPRPELAPPDSSVGADPIHGHEYDNPEQSDLQYSCTFPLPEPQNCSEGDPTCDCALHQIPGTAELVPSSPNRPLCQAPDSSYGTIQYFAKAYPPSRVLEVLAGLPSTSFVGSICPKILDPAQSSATAYGYNAILGGLVHDILGSNAGIVCLWQDMPVAEDGRVACRLLEQGPADMTCDFSGRSAAEKGDVRALEASLDADESTADAESPSYCEIDQLGGSPRDPASDAFACANQLDVPDDLAGFCYVNPAAGLGNTELVAQCRSDWQRRFRFAPGTRIRNGARVFAVCDPKFVLD